MTPHRFLCSQLVALTDSSSETAGDRIVNLEEIWITGAILEAETAVTRGVQVELRCGPAFFEGRVVEVVDEIRSAGVDQLGLLTQKNQNTKSSPPPPPAD